MTPMPSSACGSTRRTSMALRRADHRRGTGRGRMRSGQRSGGRTMRAFRLAACVVAMGLSVALVAHAADPATDLGAAKFTAKGELERPADLDKWVFIGTSLGMDYNAKNFDPASP